MILQDQQKDQLMFIHLLSISYSTNHNINEVSVSYYNDQSSESELEYSKPDWRERQKTKKVLKLQKFDTVVQQQHFE